MTTRRSLLAGAAVTPLLPLVARTALADTAPFTASKLVYITPLKSNGEESRCKAEVWFGWHEGSCYVVTQHDAWRAQADRNGLTRARLWVGEFGIWTDSDNAFRTAPEHMATASLVTDTDLHGAVLEAMGPKYTEEGWGTWGDRFRTGLANGERVMLRYAVDA